MQCDLLGALGFAFHHRASWGLITLPREQTRGWEKKYEIPTAELSAEPLAWAKIFLSFQRKRQSLDAPELFSLGQDMNSFSERKIFWWASGLLLVLLFSLYCCGGVFKISLLLFYSPRKLIRKKYLFPLWEQLGLLFQVFVEKTFLSSWQLI